METTYSSNEGSVLVADDVDIMRVTCERALRKAGFEVFSASSGSEAMKLIGSHDFEVAVLDIRMPGVSGVDLLRRIKDQRREVEVIMMTAYSDAEVAEEAMNLGASALLIKPFEDIGVLVDSVRRSMARVRRRKGLSEDVSRGLEMALRKAGLLTDVQLNIAQEHASENGLTLRRAIVALRLLNDDDLDWAVSSFLEIPYVHLTDEMLDPDLVRNFPPRLARTYGCVPLFRNGDELHLAIADPFNRDAAAEIGRALEITPVLSMGSAAEIEAFIEKFYGRPNLTQVAEALAALQKSPENGARLLNQVLPLIEVIELKSVSVEAAGDNRFNLEIKGQFRPRR